jgi:HNH endonuclease
MSELISITKGYFVEVDDEDVEFATIYKYQAEIGKNNIYACRTVKINNKKVHVYLHNEILQRMGKIIPKGFQPDHKDRNGLNDKRKNLRIVTRSINNHNSKTRYGSDIKPKGAYWHKQLQKWTASIRVDKRLIYLGVYDTEEKAIKARLKGEKQYIKYIQEYTLLDFGPYFNETFENIIETEEGLLYLKSLMNESNLNEILKLKLEFFLTEIGTFK